MRLHTSQLGQSKLQSTNQTTRVTALIASLAAIGFCGSAVAQDQPWYLSAKVGASEFELEDPFRDSLAFNDAQYDLDTRGTAFQLGLGYQLTPNYALELHYGDLGESNLSANSTLPAIQINSDVRTRVVSLDFLASYPVLDQMDVYAKLGATRWDVEADTTASGSAAFGGRVLADEQEVSAKYGLGIRYAFTKQIALGLEVEQFKAGSDQITGEEPLRTVNATVIYRF